MGKCVTIPYVFFRSFTFLGEQKINLIVHGQGTWEKIFKENKQQFCPNSLAILAKAERLSKETFSTFITDSF